VTLRHRLVAAADPDAPQECTLTREDGERRGPAITQLFAALAEQREMPRGNEFVFLGNADELWQLVTAFVDEESLCCPFYSYEQRETAAGVTLFVGAPAARVELQS
jgi:hypothetical protein